MNRTLHVLLVGVFLLAGCAAKETKTSSGKLVLEDDEQRLWRQVRDEEKRIDRSGHVLEDVELNAYLNGIAQAVAADRFKSQGMSFQIKVIKNPLLNAFTFPNGVIYVHTGILIAMENEAQVAAILGHEMIHALNRHTVRSLRMIRGTTATLTFFQIMTWPLGLYGSLANLLGTIGALGSISGYSQDFETEADTEGLALMVEAGYDPAEPAKLFAHLRQDVEDHKRKEPFFFGSHPRLEERIANYERLVSTDYPGARGKTNADQFSNKIRPLILVNTRLNIAMGRFPAAEKDLQKALDRYGESADFRFVLGEVYAQRAAPLDADKAQKEYQRAIELEPRYAVAYKALALLHYKQGHRQQAKTAFEQYLQFSPSAEDRAYMEGYLGTLAGEKGSSQ